MGVGQCIYDIEVGMYSDGTYGVWIKDKHGNLIADAVRISKDYVGEMLEDFAKEFRV